MFNYLFSFSPQSQNVTLISFLPSLQQNLTVILKVSNCFYGHIFLELLNVLHYLCLLKTRIKPSFYFYFPQFIDKGWTHKWSMNMERVSFIKESEQMCSLKITWYWILLPQFMWPGKVLLFSFLIKHGFKIPVLPSYMYCYNQRTG